MGEEFTHLTDSGVHMVEVGAKPDQKRRAVASGQIFLDENTVKMIQDLNIPTLKLAYPTTQGQIIDLIEKTNFFLKNLNDMSGTVNDDNVGADLKPKSVKCPIRDVEKIFNKSA